MHKVKPKLEWLEYELLQPYPHVQHGVFSRHGGISQGCCAGLNLGADGTFDNPQDVHRNREILREKLQVDKLLFAKQQHGTIVHRVTKANADRVPPCDALFTTERGLALGVTHADCQGAIFYDPVHEAVAVAHAGWRGSVANLYARVFDMMQRELGTQPHNLIVCISPSLGPDHAEFKNYRQELPQQFWPFQVKPKFFDFWAISRMQLTSLGVLDKNIEAAEVCTVCSAEDYFSYRRERETGRNATIVALRDN